MLIPTYLLLAIGLLGAADIVIFHTIANGIRSHADSRQELLVHSLRGPTYASLFVLIPNFAMHGGYFWLLIAIFAVDVGISLWDFAIEKRSRAVFGGLPTGEYVLHVVIAMFFGALVASVLYDAAPWAGLPTRFAYEPSAVPWPIRLLLAGMAAVVLVTELGDLRAAMRLGKPKPT